MAYTKIYYHIVWRTKNSAPTISEAHEQNLYRYLLKTIENANCRLYRINSMPDHMHMLIGLAPTLALSDFVKKVKTASSNFMRNDKEHFPKFDGWAKSYCAITYCDSERDTVIEYIKNQKEHHKKISFADELMTILRDANIEYDPRYFLKE